MLVFSADHGIAMPRAKCTLYDPGIGIALIVRWRVPGDGGVGGGIVVSDLVSNVDVLPTILEAAEVPVPGEVQGNSLLPLLRGERQPRRDAVYAEKTFHSYYDPMRCVRTERFKYVRNFEAAFAVEVPGDAQQGPIFRSDPSRYSKDRERPVELYDLREDAQELVNVAGDPRYTGEVRLHAELLVDHRLQTETNAWKCGLAAQTPQALDPFGVPIHRASREGEEEQL
jgi:arylsulfatase A-like enzyme